MIAELVLGIALLQSPEPTVTLVFRADEPTVTITVTEAWERLNVTRDARERVALVLALGTRSVAVKPLNLAPYDLERERWQRQPAQAPIPDDRDQF